MTFKVLAFACFLAVAQAGILAPVAHYAAPIAQSHSHSSVSHHSAPAHYAPVAKVALAAPVAHYSAPVAHYASPVAKLAYAAPVAKLAYAAPHYQHHEEEEYGPAEYSFEYSVHDEHTGDIKSQKEERHGDQVHGSYSLVEPDGSRRIVEYSADKHSGFNAVVHREEAKHPVAVQPVLKKVVAAPLVAAVPAYHSYQHAAPAYHSYQHAAPAYQSYQHAAPAHSYYHH